MANKTSPNSLIHCSQCGEDYSATYKRCPFCGARNAPQQSDPDRPAPSSDLDDTYVFDGQDFFDDAAGDDGASSRPRGGKRLAEKPSSNPFASADINWPRLITFICSLVIIVAAMVIVFAWIYPQLRGNRDPAANDSQSPSSSVSDPAGGATQSADPNTSDPVTEPTDSVPPSGSAGLKGFTTNTYGNDAEGFTLAAGGSWQMRLTFDPAGWNGDVTYSVSDTRYATVSATGNVVNVNQDSSLHRVILTITAGGITLEMPVYCSGAAATEPPPTGSSATEPPPTETTATEPPATNPPATDPPATEAPSGSGGIALGKEGTIVNAATGVYVRSGPDTSYEALASLFDGDSIIEVVEAAGDGWYKIRFYGENGITEAYIKGDFISTN